MKWRQSLYVWILMFLAGIKFKFIVVQTTKKEKGKDKEIVSFLFSNDGDMAVRWIESEKDFEYILKEVGHHDTNNSTDDTTNDNSNKGTNNTS